VRQRLQGGQHTGRGIRLAALRGSFNLTEDDHEKLRAVILPIARQFAPSLYLGYNPSGFFMGYTRAGRNTTYDLLESKRGESRRYTYTTDVTGTPLFTYANSTYNATLRPWFQACFNARGAPLFTDVYVFAGAGSASPSLGLSSVVAIYADLQPPVFFSLDPPVFVTQSAPTPVQREIKIVISADLALEFLTLFLSTWQIGKTGEAFVLDRTGVFLGTSAPQRLGPATTESIVHVTRVRDALVNATMEILLSFNLTEPIQRDNFSDYGRLGNVSTAILSAGGRHYRVAAARYTLLNWYVVVLVPDDDYVSGPT
jgi:hypothetical protein